MWDLSPWPGIELTPPAFEVQRLNHWTVREVPFLSFFLRGANILLGLPRCISGWRIHQQYGRRRRCEFDPWVRKIPWRRPWQPTPVFLPGESPWTEETAHVLAKSQIWLKRLSTHTCKAPTTWVGDVFPRKPCKQRWFLRAASAVWSWVSRCGAQSSSGDSQGVCLWFFRPVQHWEGTGHLGEPAQEHDNRTLSNHSKEGKSPCCVEMLSPE